MVCVSVAGCCAWFCHGACGCLSWLRCVCFPQQISLLPHTRITVSWGPEWGHWSLCLLSTPLSSLWSLWSHSNCQILMLDAGGDTRLCPSPWSHPGVSVVTRSPADGQLSSALSSLSWSLYCLMAPGLCLSPVCHSALHCGPCLLCTRDWLWPLWAPVTTRGTECLPVQSSGQQWGQSACCTPGSLSHRGTTWSVLAKYIRACKS